MRLMAFKSRSAQEKLAELEKDSSPFNDQLLEAAKFIGIDLEDVGRSITQNVDLEVEIRAPIYHGREEWLLRWLLKRLQTPKDSVPRKTPNSWILFCYLMRVIPVPNAARMLSEKKFMVILRQTLEEAQKIASNGGDAKDISGSGEDKSSKVSKKRKWSGELIVTTSESGNHVQKLPVATFAAIHQMVRFTKATSEVSEGGRSTAFSTEYMKSVIRTSAEDAAKILGSWLSLCHICSKEHNTLDTANMVLWLSPFIEIWGSRIVGNEDLVQFSLYCSQPLLSLLRVMKTGAATADWMDEMEQLAAQNIMIPAKAAKFDNADSDLLNTLTRTSVVQDSANAPILFEVAIRSLKAQGPRRRRPNDESWLQTVFATLKEAMPLQRAEDNGKAVQEMLRSALKHKLDLELSTLLSITLEYSLPEGTTNWNLLATIIKLDANVFLIPNDDKDLLRELLTRITAVSLESTWSDISVQVISDVLIPLMTGFGKARDLSSFIQHWYSQLVEFEKLRKEARLFSITLFSAWEDEVLQMEFSKVMEASLTVTQITQLLDWLSSKVAENPHAVCIILEAMAGSIAQEEVVDAVGLRLFHIMFDNAISERLDGRYKWRSWRVLSRTLEWIGHAGLKEISILWEGQAVPFDSIPSKFGRSSLLDVVDGNTEKLERLEVLRCVFAAWNVSKREARLETAVRKPVLYLLQSLAQDIVVLPRYLSGDQELGKEKCGSTLNTPYREIGWMLWSCIHSAFVEYPSVLELGLGMKGDSFRELLQTVFWIASVPQDEPPSKLNVWLRNNSDVFPSIWTSVLNNDKVFDNTALISQIIDVMLSSETNTDNPFTKSPTTNAFAVQCLLQLPLQVFSRNDRERVMKSWSPISYLSTQDASEGPSLASAAIDPAVLSLKAKVMERPTVYEGMKYQDLADLADVLASAKIEDLDVSLALFKELVRRTMSHITTNLDQLRNRGYTLDAMSHLQKKLKAKADTKKTHKLDYALVALFDVLLGAFTAKETQLNDLSIISRADFISINASFKTCLLAQLEGLLAKTKKSSKPEKQAEKFLTIRSIVDALSKSRFDGSELANLVDAAKSFSASLDQTNMDVARRLETFISTSAQSAEVEVIDSHFGGDISTVSGRQAIVDKVHALIFRKDQSEKLALLRSLLRDNQVSLTQLDKLLALRHLIMDCEDSRSSPDEDEEESLDLSTAYSILCSHLWKSTVVRQFCLNSEIMALMLRTKSRAINQWNIDSTLGSITIICSRNGPYLRQTRASTIYTQLCQLLQTLLTSHRLKLEGHFHLVVQAMQSLLRCLFTPLPHSTSKTSKLFAPPPWLSSPKHQLTATHAAAFTRLVTLICDPSVSSVTRFKHSNLTSATDKAKRLAGQHMQFVLTLYVQLQLEMKMLPEVREKMVPGLYAIFDTTTPEMRRMIGDSLDSSGRAVFGTLFRDYQRFGKWKGS